MSPVERVAPARGDEVLAVRAASPDWQPRLALEVLARRRFTASAADCMHSRLLGFVVQDRGNP